MKLLVFLIGLFIFLQAPYVYAYSSQVARQELIQLAKEVKRKDDYLVAQRELGDRAKREAQKQGLAGDSSRVAAIRLILATFGEDAGTAIAVFRAESGLRCNAVSRTYDYGVAQINAVHQWRFRGDMFDCAENLRVAYQIYQEQGFRPWVAYTNGAYLKYL